MYFEICIGTYTSICQAIFLPDHMKDKVDEMWADLYLTIYLKVNKYCKLDLHLRVGVVWKASKQLDSKDIMYVYAGSVSFSCYIGR